MLSCSASRRVILASDERGRLSRQVLRAPWSTHERREVSRQFWVDKLEDSFRTLEAAETVLRQFAEIRSVRQGVAQ